MSLMYIAFFECIAIVWVYGVKRMSANIKDMSGSYPNIFYRLCWRYVSPLLILVRNVWFHEKINTKSLQFFLHFRDCGVLASMTTRNRPIIGIRTFFQAGQLSLVGVFRQPLWPPFQLWPYIKSFHQRLNHYWR